MNNKSYVVYCHVAPNNKRYVGITCLNPPSLRFANGKGYKTQTVFYRAIQKYGWDNIKHIILLKNLNYQEAIEKEKYYIALYKTNCKKYYNPSYGYNMDDGGSVGRVDAHLNEETKEKIAHSFYHKSKSTKINYFDREGKWLGTADSCHEAARITKVTATNITKMAKGKLSGHLNGFQFRYYNETDIQNGLKRLVKNTNHYTSRNDPIYQYDLNGKFIAAFDNPRTAARIMGYANTGNIIKCAEGQYNTSQGYIWSFKKQENIGAREDKTHYPKKVNQYDLNGNYICTFSSIGEARSAIGKPKERNILKVCQGKRKKAHGFKWAYAE